MFERGATLCEWPEATWTVRLVPQLTGKAHAAYVSRAQEDTTDYTRVKEVILKQYYICEETYRQRFREAACQKDERFRDLYVRLKDLCNKWIRPEEKNINDVLEVVIMEQLLKVLTPEVQIWVKERKPKSGQEAAELADEYTVARRGVQGEKRNMQYDKRFVQFEKKNSTGSQQNGCLSEKWERVERPQRNFDKPFP